jgi:hypothetical protein
MPMKLKDKISWLMGRVQKSLFPCLDECFDAPMTQQEQRLVSILEIVQVEKYVFSSATSHWQGRKPYDRQAMVRAFVAKTLYRLTTTIDLIRALKATRNLRCICGFITTAGIPSESAFSRAFGEFAAGELGKQAHDSLVKEYLPDDFHAFMPTTGDNRFMNEAGSSYTPKAIVAI